MLAAASTQEIFLILAIVLFVVYGVYSAVVKDVAGAILGAGLAFFASSFFTVLA